MTNTNTVPTISYAGICPCGCGESVAVTFGGFAATEVTVSGCPTRRAAGIVSYTMRRSQAPAQVADAAYRHAAGLVTLA